MRIIREKKIKSYKKKLVEYNKVRMKISITRILKTETNKESLNKNWFWKFSITST